MNIDTSPMLKEYFNYQKRMEEKYGEKTVVFMEVGSFYEIYEIENRYKIGKTKEIGKILNFQITKKNNKKEHSETNPYMVGFPNHSIEKYISKLIEKRYTIIKINQFDNEDKEIKSKRREITKIYSPSTYIENMEEITNYLVCVNIEKYKEKKYGHITAIDVSTGKSYVYTAYSKNTNNDIFRIIHSLNPKEILFNYDKIEINVNQRKKIKEKLRNKFQLKDKLIHIRQINKEYKKINYQKQMLYKIFKKRDAIEYIKLSCYPELIISFICLLQFVYEHDNSIIYKIKRPEIMLDDKKLILNNDSIYQLNIISNNENKGKNGSLLNIVDKTSTNMGKRLLKYRILNPISEIKELNRRYEMIEKIKKEELYKKIKVKLSNICDIERINRKIILKKLEPNEFNLLNNSYQIILEILNISNKIIKNEKCKKKFMEYIKEYKKYFNIDNMKDVKLNNIKETFLKENINKEIDNINKEIKKKRERIEDISKLISSNVEDREMRGKITIKIIKSEQYGYHLTCNSNKIKLIKENNPNITFTKLKTYSRISSNEISEISDILCDLESNLSEKIKYEYYKILNILYDKYKYMLIRVNDIISELDVACSSAEVSIRNVYKRPIIRKNEDLSSYVKIDGIRHPIIEKIIDEEYILNNIKLEKEKKGILIYGVNASGKSSIIRALGSNIVLAQAGLYVASNKFEYYPYKLLLSKISCKDNLFKGQSTFISEMLEIKNMIEYSNKNTLILADELCAGTEGLSATSLVSSTILYLIKKSSTFMFSTHLHSLMEIPIIKKAKIYIKHFSISLKNNNIIFNRKLKEGHGTSLYGLEIAKSLNLNNSFMKQAYEIRAKLEKKNIMLLNTKKSIYNSKLYVDKCSICGINNNENNPLHTHHINFQKDTDEHGIINNKHFHKNSLHNLQILCKKCHDKVHHDKVH